MFKKEWIKISKELPPEVKTNGTYRILIDTEDSGSIEGYSYNGIFYITAFQEAQPQQSNGE